MIAPRLAPTVYLCRGRRVGRPSPRSGINRERCAASPELRPSSSSIALACVSAAAGASHRLRTQAELMHMCSCFFSACKRSWLALRASGPRSITSLASAVRTRLALAVSSAVRFYLIYLYCDTAFVSILPRTIYCFGGPRTRQGSLTDISYQRSFS